MRFGRICSELFSGFGKLSTLGSKLGPPDASRGCNVGGGSVRPGLASLSINEIGILGLMAINVVSIWWKLDQDGYNKYVQRMFRQIMRKPWGERIGGVVGSRGGFGQFWGHCGVARKHKYVVSEINGRLPGCAWKTISQHDEEEVVAVNRSMCVQIYEVVH